MFKSLVLRIVTWIYNSLQMIVFSYLKAYNYKQKIRL